MCEGEEDPHTHFPASVGGWLSCQRWTEVSDTSYIPSHTAPPPKESQSQGLVERVAGCDAGWRARGQSERECECRKSGRCRGGEEKPGLFAEAELQIESFILTLPSLFPSICPSLPASLPPSLCPSSPLRLSHIPTARERRRGGHEGGKQQSQLRRGELRREEDQRSACGGEDAQKGQI